MDIKDIKNLSPIDKNWRQHYLDYINKSNWEFPLLEGIAVHFNKSYSDLLNDFNRLFLMDYYIERYNIVSSFLYRISSYLPYVYNSTIIIPKSKLSQILGINEEVLSDDLKELSKEYRIEIADDETSKNMLEVLGFVLDENDNIVRKNTSEVVIQRKKCDDFFISSARFLSNIDTDSINMESIAKVFNKECVEEVSNVAESSEVLENKEIIVEEKIMDSNISDNYIERFSIMNDIKSPEALKEYKEYISFYSKLYDKKSKKKESIISKNEEKKKKNRKPIIPVKSEFLDNVDYEDRFLGVGKLALSNIEYFKNNYFDTDNPLTIGEMAKSLSVIDSSVLNQINYLKKKENMSMKILGNDMTNIEHKKKYYYVRYFNPNLDRKLTASEMSYELEISVKDIYLDLDELAGSFESNRKISISTKNVVEDVDIVDYSLQENK